MTLKRFGGTRQVGRIARRISAYIPRTLTDRILHGEILEPGTGRRFHAAVLFCDISGFSRMANELGNDGPRGAEELNRILLMTFTAMINAIHNAGGIVTHFHGDAMTICVENDDGQAANHAVALGQFLQSLMGGAYSEVVANRPNNEKTTYQLTMKVGVGFGECLEVIVGHPGSRLEYVLAGSAIDEASQAEANASAGDVIVSRSILEALGLPAVAPYQPFRDVLPVPFVPRPIHWDAYGTEMLWDMASVAGKFVPTALWERIGDDSTNYVTEHRQISSIFVKFEGIDYSAEDAPQKLQAYYTWASEIVSQYGSGNCHVNRLLTGDKGSQLHILFGAPIAPDAPEQALRCAAKLQESCPDFITEQAIGVSAGQAFACALGSQNRREYTTVGDTVNLSARLMSKAEPGQVLVDQFTAARAEGLVRLNRIGDMKFKGFSDEIEVFEVKSVPTVTGPLVSHMKREDRPNHGRRYEERQVLHLLNQALDGDGGAALITGSTHNDQVRALSAAIDYWEKQSGRVTIGLGQDHLSEYPYGVWHNIWWDIFQLDESDPVEEHVKQVKKVVRLIGPSHSRDIPMLEPVLDISLPMQRKTLIGFGVAEQQSRLFDLLRQILIHLAGRQPLLIILENVQRADHSSLALARHFVQNLSGAPVFLLMTAGENKATDPAELVPNAHIIQLDDIPVDEGRKLVQRMLNDKTVPNGLYDHLGLVETGGVVNPAVLEENINSLLDNQAILTKDRVALDRTRLAEQPVAANINSLVLAKLDRLSAQGRSFLQAASILGREFEPMTVLSTLIQLSKEDAKTVMRELIQNNFIVPAGEKLIFENDVIREVAYESIPYGRRKTWHTEIAQWFTKQAADRPNLYPVVAYHYDRADNHERSLYFSLMAGDTVRQTAPITAIQLYSMGEPHLESLGLETHWQQALELYTARGELYWVGEQYAAAAEDARKATEIAQQYNDPVLQVISANLLARIEVRQGNYDQAIQLIDQIKSQVDKGPTEQYLAHAEINYASALLYLGRHEEALQRLDRAEFTLATKDDPAGLVRIYLLRGFDYYAPKADWEAALNQYRIAQRMITQTGIYSIENMIRLMVGMAQALMHTEKIDRAQSYLKHAADVAVENGLRWWRPSILYFQGVAYLLQGRISRANTLFERGVKAVRAGGNPSMRPLLLIELARLNPNPMMRLDLINKCEQALEDHCRASDMIFCLEMIDILREEIE